MLCFLLINFIDDEEMDGLAADLVPGIFVVANNLSYTPPIYT